ncbi:hypothetical protein HN011_009267, partial [Eciton burchellii]
DVHSDNDLVNIIDSGSTCPSLLLGTSKATVRELQAAGELFGFVCEDPEPCRCKRDVICLIDEESARQSGIILGGAIIQPRDGTNVQTIETGECPFGRVGHGIGDDIAHGDNKGTVNQEQTNERKMDWTPRIS